MCQELAPERVVVVVVLVVVVVAVVVVVVGGRRSSSSIGSGSVSDSGKCNSFIASIRHSGEPTLWVRVAMHAGGRARCPTAVS